MSEEIKFEYGYDVNAYLEKAVEVFKNEYHYHWADVSLFNEQERYDIEEENGEYHYLRYVTFSEDDIEKEVLDVDPWSPYPKVLNAEGFIRRIVSENEYNVQHWNKKDLIKDEGLKKFLGFEN